MNGQKRLYQRLLHLSAQLASTLNFGEIEQFAVSLLPKAFAADACAVIRLGPEREEGRVSAAFPFKEQVDQVLSREECQDILPFLAAEDVRQIHFGDAPGLVRLLQRFELKCALLYSLATEETLPPFLLLGFASDEIPQSTELSLFKTMGRQVARSLDQALLYQQSHRRLREIRLLHEVSLAISSNLDFDQILSRVVPALCQGLLSDFCIYYFMDPAGKVLRAHVASHGLSVPAASLVIPLDRGVTGQVLQTGQAMFIPDVAADPRCSPEDCWGANSLICVPVLVGGEIVAILQLGGNRPYAFSREDFFLLNNVAGQLAVAVERGRAFQQAGQRVRDLTTLMWVSTVAQHATRQEDVVELLLAEATKLVGTERGCILLADRQTGWLRIAASQGIPQALIAEVNEGRGIPSSFGTFSIILSSGEMLEILDTSTDPRIERGILPVPPQLTNIPLKTDRGVIGVVELGAVSSDEPTRRLLLSLSEIAAVALDRIYLFEEMRLRLQEMRFLQEIALAATSTLEFEEVLRRSTVALRRLLDFEVFGFLTVDEKTGLLHLHPDFVGVPDELRHFTIPIGQGITGWVAQTGEPYLTADVHTDAHYYGAISPVRSEVCVPVKVGGRVVAVMDLESRHPNAFGRDELRLLSAMADQLASALQNAQLYEQEQEQRRMTEAMRQAAVVLGATWDVDELLRQSLQHLQLLLPYDASFLVLFRDGHVERALTQGCSLPAPEQWLTPDTLGQSVYAEHRAIVIPDVQKAPSWKFWPGVEGLRSWIGVPFLSKEAVFGMLLMAAAAPNTYDWEDAKIVFSFAGQLAVAIERARFYEQERRQAEQLNLLYRVGQRVQGIVDLEPLLEETIFSLHEAFGAYQTSLAMVQGNHLVVWAATGRMQLKSPLPQMMVSCQDSGIIPWVARKNMPLLVADVTQDSRFRAVPHFPHTRTEMAVPLQAKGKVIAVLDVQGDRVDQFDEQDLSTLQAIGSQVAGAIDRAILYMDLRESVEQLQETDRLRRDFLSTINHEMRAPLTAILGFADFLLREQAGPLSSVQREYLGDIRAAGERILTLVENLLEAARLEDGQVLPCHTVVHLETVIARTMAIVQPAAMEKALTLSVDIPEALPPARADVMMLERILINLLSNAVNYTPPGGSVWVEVRLNEQESDMLQVSVCDTGIGIDPRHFDKLFQRYFRLETPSVGPVGGTGLGLYIVKGLVEALGGRIWVESQVSQGSKFRFTLPLAAPAQDVDL